VNCFTQPQPQLRAQWNFVKSKLGPKAGWGMSNTNDADVCDVCHRGTVVRKEQEIAFHQWTIKGCVFCRVTVPVAICAECGARSWDETAEAIVEEAVKQEVDKLS
jgi:hypothetical protein